MWIVLPSADLHLLKGYIRIPSQNCAYYGSIRLKKFLVHVQRVSRASFFANRLLRCY